jgi:hypothetical protein
LAIVIGLFPKNFFAAVGRANCSWGVVNFCLLQNLEDLNPGGKVTQGNQQECMPLHIWQNSFSVHFNQLLEA